MGYLDRLRVKREKRSGTEKQEKLKSIILLKDYKSGHPNFLACG